MSKILKIRNVGDYSQWVGHTDTHPLVSVIDYAEVSPVRHCLNNYSVYGIFFHDEANIDLAYGCGKYDYKEGTVICVAPGQIGGKEDNGELVNLTGWALLFHPDLLQGTALEKHIREYSFFDYRVNEALHMTDEEHDILVSLMRQIKDELLPAFLQPPVHHPQAGQLGHAHEVRPAPARLLRRENPAYLGHAHRAILCRQTMHVGQLFRRPYQEDDRGHGQ